MDPDTISFLRDICKKVKEMAEISGRFLALQAAKKATEDSFPFPLSEAKESQNRSCVK